MHKVLLLLPMLRKDAASILYCRIKEHKDGLIRPCTWGIVGLSCLALALSYFNILPIPSNFDVDEGVMTEIFVLLWGITQALILFYMEHKKDQVLGITLDKIVQVSMGKALVISTLALFILEMICWIFAVCIHNRSLIFYDLFLQIVDIVAAFFIIHYKQKPLSVLGTCKWQVKHDKKTYTQSRWDEKDFPQLLILDVLAQDNVSITFYEKEIKNILLAAYEEHDIKDTALRFKYEYELTKKICNCSKFEQINNKSKKKTVSEIPLPIKWYFEDYDSQKDLFSLKAILSYFINLRNKYNTDKVIDLIKLLDPPQKQLYAWCGILSIYWMKYSSDDKRQADILKYKKLAEGATVDIMEFLKQKVTKYESIIFDAIEIWEENTLG